MGDFTPADRLVGYSNPAYDQAAKRILAQRKIMAYILKGVVAEFVDADIDDIADKYIEGDIIVSEMALNPDKTNASRSVTKIRGLQSESGSPTEGWITFDILFYVVSPLDGERIKMIINVESQKTQRQAKLGYDLLHRAIYYGSRLISSQKEVDFVGSDYDAIKKVYTIWICMDSPVETSAINRYAIHEEQLLGDYTAPQKSYDLLTAIMVYLGNDRNKDRMIRLLQILFKEPKKSAAEKEEILNIEYEVDITHDLAEEMRNMCNLSEGIFERGMLANKIETAINMLKEKMELDIISRITSLSATEIREIARDNGLSVV